MDTIQKETSIAPVMQLNVGAQERVISVLGGAYLLLSAIRKRELGLVKAVAAGYLIFRGATGYCPALQVLGKTEVDHRARNVNIKTSLTVNRPRHEVYGFWRRLENLPRFMKHLDSVVVLDEHFSEWKAKIPGGMGTITWRSEVVRDEAGSFLSWQSQKRATIENAGKVEFIDAGKFGTEVHVVISYHAPLGVVGEKAAKLFNPLFENMVREDIKNFKRYIETGEIPTIEGQPSGRKNQAPDKNKKTPNYSYV